MIGDIITCLLNDARISGCEHQGTSGPCTSGCRADAIMVTITDMETNPTKTGTSSDDIIELDVTVYSRTAKQGFDVAENIRSSLDNFTGTMGTTEVQSLALRASI